MSYIQQQKFLKTNRQKHNFLNSLYYGNYMAVINNSYILQIDYKHMDVYTDQSYLHYNQRFLKLFSMQITRYLVGYRIKKSARSESKKVSGPTLVLFVL